MTEQAIATTTRTGPAWTFEKKKAADEHKLSMERSLLFGERKVAYSSGLAQYATRGLKPYVASANAFSVGGPLPEFDFDDWVRLIFRAGTGDAVSNTKILLANDRLLAIINRYAKTKMMTEGSDKSYGMNISTYVTPHGIVKMVYHRLLDDYSSTKGYGLLYDPANINLRYFGGNGIDGHTQLHENIQANDATLRKDEYRTTVGLEVKHGTTHGEISNVTG